MHLNKLSLSQKMMEQLKKGQSVKIKGGKRINGIVNKYCHQIN